MRIGEEKPRDTAILLHVVYFDDAFVTITHAGTADSDVSQLHVFVEHLEDSSVIAEHNEDDSIELGKAGLEVLEDAGRMLHALDGVPLTN